jgi:hypothetical protein
MKNKNKNPTNIQNPTKNRRQRQRVSVAHIADDIQKQSKTFYLLYI